MCTSGAILCVCVTGATVIQDRSYTRVQLALCILSVHTRDEAVRTIIIIINNNKQNEKSRGTVAAHDCRLQPARLR